MVGVMEGGTAAGESGRMGGVPKRGGLVPIELESAAARAETPGPGTLDPAAPASGAGGPASESFSLACEVCCGGGVPNPWEGIGEANLAVASARGTDVLIDRLRNEPGEADLGTGKGIRGAGDSRPESDIFEYVATWYGLLLAIS